MAEGENYSVRSNGFDLYSILFEKNRRTNLKSDKVIVVL